MGSGMGAVLLLTQVVRVLWHHLCTAASMQCTCRQLRPSNLAHCGLLDNGAHSLFASYRAPGLPACLDSVCAAALHVMSPQLTAAQLVCNSCSWLPMAGPGAVAHNDTRSPVCRSACWVMRVCLARCMRARTLTSLAWCWSGCTAPSCPLLRRREMEPSAACQVRNKARLSHFASWCQTGLAATCIPLLTLPTSPCHLICCSASCFSFGVHGMDQKARCCFTHSTSSCFCASLVVACRPSCARPVCCINDLTFAHAALLANTCGVGCAGVPAPG